MELSRYEVAAIKRTAQNVKMLRNKLAKVTEKYEKIASEKAGLEEEIANWETPILKKYGFSSEQILSGEADKLLAMAEEPQTDGTAIDTDSIPEKPETDTIASVEEDPFAPQASTEL